MKKVNPKSDRRASRGALPDASGHFGVFGGKYIPETLIAAVEELEGAYKSLRKDRKFQDEYHRYLSEYVGRPTPLYYARRFSDSLGGAKVYLKREDLCHTGAHKINNTIGQILIAKRMGKRRIIAETGAGQHGVAVATVCTLFGFECVIYMGEEDMSRQAPNVERMRLLGAEVRKVSIGSKTLKDAISEAIRDWVTNVRTTFYIVGSVVGMHPYPMIVRDFQTIIGKETKQQILKAEGKLPNVIVACVGGGSNSLGIFYPFLKNRRRVKLVGVEAGGLGLPSGKHAAPLAAGQPGVLHGSMQYLLQDRDGQIKVTHSVSAGLDYPGVGPEHSYLKETGRVQYVTASDTEALRAFEVLSRLEGIIPALEPAHALSHVMKIAPKMSRRSIIVLNLSGRGDKDLATATKALRL